jgi:methyl-accepting chemotaxis protein
MKKKTSSAVKKTSAKKSNRKAMKQSTAIKILSGISVITIILVFAMLFWNRSASNHFDVVMDERDQLVASTNLFGDTSAYLTQQARFYAATSQQEYYDNYWREVNTDQNREKAIADMRAVGITSEEEAMLTSMSNTSNSLVSIEDEAMNLAGQGENMAAVSLLFSGAYADGAEQIQNTAQQLTEVVKARKEAELDKVNLIIDSSYYAMFICLILVAVIQLSVIRYTRKRILNPVKAVEVTMGEVAHGNLDAPLDLPEDQTEIGNLVHAVNETKRRTSQIIEDIGYELQEISQGNFGVRSRCEDSYVGSYRPILGSIKALKRKQNSLISQIGAAAQQVSSGSAQVSASSQELAQGATQQTSSIEALSETIDRISNDVTANAKLVSDATAQVENVGANIVAGNEKMNNMVEAMQEIEEKSNQIANIIKTIDDISFQTNILALNAAVEAARAGTAGKGFAVVANEVRSLASKSSDAAKDTAELITGATDAVKKGTQIVNETAQTLQEVMNNITEIINTIKNIEAASEKQSAGTMQITSGIGEISDVVQKTQSMASESANTSEALAGQAQMLKDLVNQFHLVNTIDA